MQNKVYADFSKEKFNEDKNYQAILSKVKEEKAMKKRRMLNIAAILVVVIMIGCMAPSIYAKRQWDIQFKEYQSRPIGEAKGNLEEARESDYAEVLNMDYLVQDGIGIKVEALLLTDDCFDAKVKIRFPEDKEVNSDSFRFGFVVYDENKNIYAVCPVMNYEAKRDYITPFIYEELDVKYNKHDIYALALNDSYGIEKTEVNTEERTITSNINIRARDSFPQSKKIYIRIFDLGYDMYDLDSVNLDTHTIAEVEQFNISDARWIFEIDVPDKFYERNTFELKLAQEIPGFELEKATLTETSLVLRFKSQDYLDLIMAGKDMASGFSEAMQAMLNITDGTGKMYQDIGGGTRGEGSYKMTLDAGKQDLEKKLFVNFTVNGKTYTSELVEK